MSDAVIIALGGVALSGVTGLVTAIAARKTVSRTDLDLAVDKRVNTYMAATDREIAALKKEHEDCETRIRGLKGILFKLVKALRDRGIPLPIFEAHEEVMMLEHRSFQDGNGHER